MTAKPRDNTPWIWIALAAVFLIPVACILGVILLGAATGALTYLRLSDEMQSTAEYRAERVRQAALLYQVEHGPAACPTIDELTASGELAASESYDPWAGDFRIECGREIRVKSAGVDREWDTGDDIVAP
jgi:hypothetical protein